MKLPEKYPDGFVVAAKKDDTLVDMDIIKEGLELYAREFEEVYNSTPDVEAHLMMVAMMVFIKTTAEADPLSYIAAKALLRNVKVETVVCKVSRKKK